MLLLGSRASHNNAVQQGKKDRLMSIQRVRWATDIPQWLILCPSTLVAAGRFWEGPSYMWLGKRIFPAARSKNEEQERSAAASLERLRVLALLAVESDRVQSAVNDENVPRFDSTCAHGFEK